MKLHAGIMQLQPVGTCESTIGISSSDCPASRMQRRTRSYAPKEDIANSDSLRASPTQSVCS